jgi:hypothetical protein
MSDFGFMDDDDAQAGNEAAHAPAPVPTDCLDKFHVPIFMYDTVAVAISNDIRPAIVTLVEPALNRIVIAPLWFSGNILRKRGNKRTVSGYSVIKFSIPTSFKIEI